MEKYCYHHYHLVDMYLYLVCILLLNSGIEFRNGGVLLLCLSWKFFLLIFARLT